MAYYLLNTKALTLYIEAERKWPSFHRRPFQGHFSEWDDDNLIEVCSLRSK